MRSTCAAALLTCVTLAGVPAFAAGPDGWVPARWQGGPLELQRRARDATLPDAPALRETIRQWYDPATLDLLQGTPINCLLVTWSAGGSPETEREQHELVGAYARAARARGIAVLGLVHGPATSASLIEPLIAAGLDGLVLEGAFPERETLASEVRQALRNRGKAAVVVFPVAPREQLTPESDILATTDGVRPAVRELAADAEAGPSSEPWIDSNLWLVQSIRSQGGSRPVWLMHALPAQATPADYLRAIADAAAGGGRWVLAPDDDLRHGLRTNQAGAMTTWRQIAAFLKFHQEHAEWYGYQPMAACGFLQDSAGNDRDGPGANLRLAVRTRIPLRVIERSQLSAPALVRLRAVHAIDLVQPTALERKILTEFVHDGGLLVVGPSWEKVEMPDSQDFAVAPAGKGRIAVYREGADPWELAKSLVDLLGRDNLGVRLLRAASVLSHVSVGPAGKDVLVHLLNYASYPAESVLVRANGDYQRVVLYTPERAPEELRLERAEGRVEAIVGRLPVYGVLRFEK
jgi:hypothetical protein